jgi:hypothetical protein
VRGQFVDGTFRRIRGHVAGGEHLAPRRYSLRQCPRIRTRVGVMITWRGRQTSFRSEASWTFRAGQARRHSRHRSRRWSLAIAQQHLCHAFPDARWVLVRKSSQKIGCGPPPLEVGMSDSFRSRPTERRANVGNRVYVPGADARLNDSFTTSLWQHGTNWRNRRMPGRDRCS